MRKRHLKLADVILIAVILLIGSIQLVRWHSKEELNNSANESPTEQVRQDFIKEIAPTARKEQRRYHVLASITIAQAALESDWGQSELATKYNNLFGVKETGTNSALMTTKEYVNGQWIEIKASFAVYPSWQKSIEAHTKLFVDGLEGDQAHYQQVINATNYQQAAQALQENGYATDPDYAQKLITIIEKYRLYRFDQ